MGLHAGLFVRKNADDTVESRYSHARAANTSFAVDGEALRLLTLLHPGVLADEELGG